MMYLWLLLGFVFLVKGADLFVDGCSSIAKTLRVPSIIIGLTIVAFGTSAPEASVSIMASLSGNNDIAISNVIGSNLFNSLAVIGVCGVVLPMKIQGGLLKKEMPFSILVTGLLLLFCMFSIGGGKGVLQIGRLEGADTASAVRGISVYADKISTEDPHRKAGGGEYRQEAFSCQEYCIRGPGYCHDNHRRGTGGRQRK